MPHQNGSCLCGAIQYQLTAAPVATAICHCNHCQKQTGTSFSLVQGVTKTALNITDTTSLKVFEDVGDSGQAVHRHFCGSCGSPIYSYAESSPDLVWIKTGTLEDRSQLQPQLQIWQSRTQPWLQLDSHLTSFNKNPEMA